MTVTSDMEVEAARLLDAGDEAVEQALDELEGDARALLSTALVTVASRRALAEADGRIEENGDGTLIVRLTRPIRVDGAELHRITVGRVKVRHVRAARQRDDEIDVYADALVSPDGAAGELEADADYTAVLRAVERQLGKFRAGGART